MASRQTSLICFSWVFCFADVDFALDFVLLIGIFANFTLSTFVRCHSIVGPDDVAVDDGDTIGVAIGDAFVAAVVSIVVQVEH